MVEESKIFGGAPEKGDTTQGFHDFKLLKITDNASLYLAFKAGKRFLIKTTKDNSERQNAMLHREYELSIGCDHPHLVHIYTIEDLPFGTGLVMEYIEGRPLDKYLSENPSKKERERIFSELLAAVCYLHKRGVIHNDIKPENILITHADNSLKLIDFGLADNDAQFAMRTLGCTPRYASPELRAQSSRIDARSDIYSIGMLMGEIFDNKHRCIAERCRQENPDKRFKNIAALQLAWHHRRRPLKVVLGIVSSVIFILPILLFGQTKLVEYNKTKEREQLFVRIERDVERIYTLASDSISRAVYYEFANNHIVSFWEELAKYQQKHIVTISDAELNTLATNVYTHTVNKYHNKLWDMAKALPIIHREGISIDELMFYDSLLTKRQPYHSYGVELPKTTKDNGKIGR